MSKVAIYGAGGGVGAQVARELARADDVTTLYLYDINADALQAEAMDAVNVAEKYRGGSLEVVTQVLDMKNEDAVAQSIAAAKADVLIQAAIPFSWYRISRTLPPDVWKNVFMEGRLGPWLPLFTLLPVKLMRGRRMAGVTTPVVQISLPDCVNPLLSGMGMEPTCGAGNTDSVTAVLKARAARKLGVPLRDLTVRMVAHHFHSGFMRSPAKNDELQTYPWWFKVYAAGVDVTDQFTSDEFLTEWRAHFPLQRPLYAASSAAKNTLRILRDDPTITHVVAPGGLAGGVDCRLTSAGAVPVWHPEMPEAKAMELLRKAGEGDGIAGYDADGSARITERAHAALVKYMNYDCPVLRPAEVEERAEELVAKLNEAARVAA
ncbi:MAG: saccharopine dehydrogenase NADP-binding domain-containing protein [Rhodobacteraceae bacterium]|nr:saccharopine dehydrogenase NADP-binding domain-containing protein [Paracoccaceae bacterium]